MGDIKFEEVTEEFEGVDEEDASLEELSHEEMDIDELPTASLGNRIVAHLIDLVVSGCLNAGIVIGLSLFNIPLAQLMSMLFVTFVYWITPTYFDGQTLGKRLMHIKVIRKDGMEELGMVKVLLRETIGRMIGMMVFGLGYIWVFFNKNRFAWHDYVGGTHVIDVRDRG